jgi:hypothetical protein
MNNQFRGLVLSFSLLLLVAGCNQGQGKLLSGSLGSASNSSSSTTTPTSSAAPASGAVPVYSSESPTVVGTKTGGFHTQQIGDRIWLIAPDGKGFFPREVQLFTDGSSGAGGNRFLSYDKVVLQPNDGSFVTVSDQAKDSNPGDVLITGKAYTLKNVGDTIYIGSARFKPEYTHIQAQALGVGGTINWYYLDSSGTWVLINGTGAPFSAAELNAEKSYYMDVGTGALERGVAANGLLAPYGTVTLTNKLTWWNTGVSCPGNGSCTWPADFAKHAVAGIDTVARYYIKGVVEKAFSSPPIISQIFETGTTTEVINAKYSGIGDTAFIKWANNDSAKLIKYGINAAGMYSNRYEELYFDNIKGDGGITLNPETLMPVSHLIQSTSYVMRVPTAFNPPLVTSSVKNIMSNVGATFCPGYEGISPDVFDPGYAKGLINGLQYSTGQGNWKNSTVTIPDPSKVYSYILEEADDLFLINSVSHNHLGVQVLMANPYMPADAGHGMTYTDPTFYSKVELSSFLEKKYVTIAALNAAWGTKYTVWGTSSGVIASGTNAYKTGTGFMDEDGSHVLKNCATSYNTVADAVNNSKILADLDAYTVLWTQTYGEAIHAAVTAVLPANHPPVSIPLYDGPNEAYAALTPYTDTFWASVSPVDSLASATITRILASTTKPVFIGSYMTATQQTQLGFNATVAKVSYDASTDSSTIVADSLNYWFGSGLSLLFPSSSGCPTVPPEAKSADWSAMTGTTMVVPGNYSTCVSAGQNVQPQAPGTAWLNDYPTFASMEQAEILRFNTVIAAKNSAGVAGVIGIGWWGMYPEELVAGLIPNAYGFFTYNDNMYDGVSDLNPAGGADANGYPTGGEEADYGNRVNGTGLLGPYLTNIYTEVK